MEEVKEKAGALGRQGSQDSPRDCVWMTERKASRTILGMELCNTPLLNFSKNTPTSSRTGCHSNTRFPFSTCYLLNRRFQSRSVWSKQVYGLQVALTCDFVPTETSERSVAEKALHELTRVAAKVLVRLIKAGTCSYVSCVCNHS